MPPSTMACTCAAETSATVAGPGAAQEQAYKHMHGQLHDKMAEVLLLHIIT